MATAKKTETNYESKYGIDELANASREAFGTRALIVRAALKQGGKEEYTMAEATKIVEKFKNKEVKA